MWLFKDWRIIYVHLCVAGWYYLKNKFLGFIIVSYRIFEYIFSDHFKKSFTQKI